MSATLFPLGQTVITRDALAVLDPQDVQNALNRHAHGDWGDLGEADREANDMDLQEGHRLFSAYTDRNQTKFYVITEHDRSVTTVLLPKDY